MVDAWISGGWGIPVSYELRSGKNYVETGCSGIVSTRSPRTRRIQPCVSWYDLFGSNTHRSARNGLTKLEKGAPATDTVDASVHVLCHAGMRVLEDVAAA